MVSHDDTRAAAPAWDPGQYARYADYRTRPLRELLDRVPDPPSATPRIADLGCGPGDPTRRIAARWPHAHVTGYDSSATMLDRASAYAGPTGGGEPGAGGTIDFAHADLAQWQPTEPFDLLLSNAALQWVIPAGGKGRVIPTVGKGRVIPAVGKGRVMSAGGRGEVASHAALFPAWIDALNPGGTLAFQVPGNFTAPSHTLLHELRNSPRWRARVGAEARGRSVLEPAGYWAALADLGCEVDAWETTYLHVLHGEDPVLEWTKGTALRPVLTLLEDDPEARDAFLAEYAAGLREAYPPGRHGTVFPFRRIFVVAVKR